MEDIYRPDKFVCSEHIPLKQYFEEFSLAVVAQADPCTKYSDEKLKNQIILNVMRIDDRRERRDLIQGCSINLLTVPGEELPIHKPDSTKECGKSTTPLEIPEAGNNLNTVKVKLAFQNKDYSLYAKDKYTKDSHETTLEMRQTEEGDILPGSQFAVSVRVYHPFNFKYNSENTYHNVKFSHEIILLSSNTLAHLRDKILCHVDAEICTEVDVPTTDIQLGNAKEKYPSGFIFIDDVFYNDIRHPCTVDYSAPIIEWANERGIGPFQVSELHTKRIDELTPRFGYPYVYQHQGKCEHILVFSDAWLITRSHSLSSIDYPYYQGIHRFYSKLCCICGTSAARWFCVDCERLPTSKTSLCQDCIVSYCYKDGKKIGKFKVYPFFDRNNIL